MKHALCINAHREGYALSQIRRTMTAGELISYLEQFDEGTPVFLKHDGGYTYGAILGHNFEDEDFVSEDDNEDTDMDWDPDDNSDGN